MYIYIILIYIIKYYKNLNQSLLCSLCGYDNQKVTIYIYVINLH